MIREILKQLSPTGTATGITATALSSSQFSRTNLTPDDIISTPQGTSIITATSPLVISSNKSNGSNTLQTFADLARHCPQTGSASIPDAHRGKPKSTAIIGKVTRTKLVGVAKKKNIDPFVSQLEPNTTVDGVQVCVIEAFVNDYGLGLFQLK